jgi:hypothetical protein
MRWPLLRVKVPPHDVFEKGVKADACRTDHAPRLCGNIRCQASDRFLDGVEIMIDIAETGALVRVLARANARVSVQFSRKRRLPQPQNERPIRGYLFAVMADKLMVLLRSAGQFLAVP